MSNRPEWTAPKGDEPPPRCPRCETQRLSDRTARRRGYCDMCQFGDLDVFQVADRLRAVQHELERRELLEGP